MSEKDNDVVHLVSDKEPDAHRLTYVVETGVVADCIHQSVTVEDALRKQQQKIMAHVIDLQDQGVREALIRMGWTPPPEKTKSGGPYRCVKCGARVDHGNFSEEHIGCGGVLVFASDD